MDENEEIVSDNGELIKNILFLPIHHYRLFFLSIHHYCLRFPYFHPCQ